MEKIRFLYYFGVLLLFLGLLWMFLLHAYHQKLLNEKEEVNHLLHIFQGVIIALIGLIIVIWTNRKSP